MAAQSARHRALRDLFPASGWKQGGVRGQGSSWRFGEHLWRGERQSRDRLIVQPRLSVASQETFLQETFLRWGHLRLSSNWEPSGLPDSRCRWSLDESPRRFARGCRRTIPVVRTIEESGIRRRYHRSNGRWLRALDGRSSRHRRRSDGESSVTAALSHRTAIRNGISVGSRHLCLPGNRRGNAVPRHSIGRTLPHAAGSRHVGCDGLGSVSVSRKNGSGEGAEANRPWLQTNSTVCRGKISNDLSLCCDRDRQRQQDEGRSDQRCGHWMNSQTRTDSPLIRPKTERIVWFSRSATPAIADGIAWPQRTVAISPADCCRNYRHNRYSFIILTGLFVSKETNGLPGGHPRRGFHSVWGASLPTTQRETDY